MSISTLRLLDVHQFSLPSLNCCGWRDGILWLSGPGMHRPSGWMQRGGVNIKWERVRKVRELLLIKERMDVMRAKRFFGWSVHRFFYLNKRIEITWRQHLSLGILQEANTPVLSLHIYQPNGTSSCLLLTPPSFIKNGSLSKAGNITWPQS